MHLAEWTDIFVIVGVLITAAAAVGGSFRVGRNTQAVNTYRDTALALEQQNKVQAQQITDLQHEASRKDIEVTGMRERIRTLEEVVTARDLIEALGIKLNEVHDDVKTLLQERP